MRGRPTTMRPPDRILFAWTIAAAVIGWCVIFAIAFYLPEALAWFLRTWVV